MWKRTRLLVYIYTGHGLLSFIVRRDIISLHIYILVDLLAPLHIYRVVENLSFKMPNLVSRMCQSWMSTMITHMRPCKYVSLLGKWGTGTGTCTICPTMTLVLLRVGHVPMAKVVIMRASAATKRPRPCYGTQMTTAFSMGMFEQAKVVRLQLFTCCRLRASPTTVL